MKPIVTTRSRFSLCDCGDICANDRDWWGGLTDAIIRVRRVTEIKEEKP